MKTYQHPCKKAHVFDVLHSAFLISLIQLCDYYCIAILYKNEINVIKKYTYFKETQKQDRWLCAINHLSCFCVSLK